MFMLHYSMSYKIHYIMIYSMLLVLKKILQYIKFHLNLIQCLMYEIDSMLLFWKFRQFQRVIFHPFNNQFLYLNIFCLFNNNISTVLKYENMILDPCRTVRFTPNITCIINTHVSSLFLFLFGICFICPSISPLVSLNFLSISLARLIL
jgi:hypothetical protein